MGGRKMQGPLYVLYIMWLSSWLFQGHIIFLCHIHLFGSSQILYTGRCQSLGIKQGGPNTMKWAELPIIKSPKICQYSVGHEGGHALLVGEDGSVFFVGTPRRGEDGDGSLC